MNKILILSVFFFSLITAAQTVKTGKYLSDIPGGQQLTLKINEDQTFELVFLEGEYMVQADAILLNFPKTNEGSFVLKKVHHSDVPVSKLTIHIDASMFYYLDQIYMGLDSHDVLSKLSSYLDYETLNYENIVIEVPKPDTLYFLDYKKGASDYSSFDVPAGIDEVSLSYAGVGFAGIPALTLTVDKDDPNKIYITDGNNPIAFNYIEEGAVDTNVLKPSASGINTDWKPAFSLEDAELESVETIEVGEGTYKLKVFPTYKEALASLQDSEKLLVMVYDEDDEQARQQFDAFKSGMESYLAYDNGDDSYNNFEFYLAKKEDKALFEKNQIKQFPAIMVVNAEGTKLYDTSGTIKDNGDLFTPYYSIYTQLKEANLKTRIDAVLSAKKPDLEAFKSTLYEAMEIVSPYVPDSTYDLIGIEAEDYDIKDAEHLYTLKSSQSAIENAWLSLLKAHQADTTLDEELADVLKRELHDDGFTKKLFKSVKKNLTDSDKLGVEYLLKFRHDIANRDKEALDFYEENYYSTGVQEVLSSLMSRILDATDDVSKNRESMDYFKQILLKTDYEFGMSIAYLNALQTRETLKKESFLPTFKAFFDARIDMNQNIIEQFDTYFSASASDIYADWTSFKYSFSDLANNAAWYVVTDFKDSAYVHDAIQWSEVSNVLNKDNGYYLDTLAQLYYLNGQKEQAIQTERKALSHIDGLYDPGTYEEVKEVLKRMEEGSY